MEEQGRTRVGLGVELGVGLDGVGLEGSDGGGLDWRSDWRDRTGVSDWGRTGGRTRGVGLGGLDQGGSDWGSDWGGRTGGVGLGESD